MVHNSPGHDHIVRSWHEWEIDRPDKRRILVVETDAPLQPEEHGYSPGLIEDVRLAAVTAVRASAGAIDRIRIVPVRY